MWTNPAEAFKELDSKEHLSFAQSLSAYMKALEDSGFTRKEAMSLVKIEARFQYDMILENMDDDDEDSTVDPDETMQYTAFPVVRPEL